MRRRAIDLEELMTDKKLDETEIAFCSLKSACARHVTLRYREHLFEHERLYLAIRIP